MRILELSVGMGRCQIAASQKGFLQGTKLGGRDECPILAVSSHGLTHCRQNAAGSSSHVDADIT